MDKIDYENYQGFLAADADESVLRDSVGRMRTRSLFHETFDYRTKASGMTPLYTLAEDTKHGLPSFWRIYMTCLTEYDAARKLVGGIRHWDALLATRWFHTPTLRDSNGHYILGLNKWREYKEQQDQSYVRELLLSMAKGGNVAAAKALLTEKAPIPKTTEKKKKEADEVSAQMDSEDQAVQKDAQLLKLVP